MRLTVWILLITLLTSCAHGHSPTTPPHFPDIERGRSIPPLDWTASALAAPVKILLWNRRYATHKISPETETVLADFIRKNELRTLKVRLNQWAPFDEIKRIVKNDEVGLPYRLFAIPFSFLTAAMGRPLGGLVMSDYYDPFSNTIHIYSDDIAIALHEAGHAKDFAKQQWRGTYALVRSFPGVNLAQELIATHEAFDYLDLHGPEKERIRAPAVLYPAFATYAGSYLTMIPFGWVGALLGGHLYGRLRSRYIREEIETRRPLLLDHDDGHIGLVETVGSGREQSEEGQKNQSAPDDVKNARGV